MTTEKLLTPSQSEKENDNGLRDMVNHIADQLTNGFGEDLSEGRDIENEGEFSAYDYLSDVLDINWILNNDRTYKGARVLVAFGALMFGSIPILAKLKAIGGAIVLLNRFLTM